MAGDTGRWQRVKTGAVALTLAHGTGSYDSGELRVWMPPQG